MTLTSAPIRLPATTRLPGSARPPSVVAQRWLLFVAIVAVYLAVRGTTGLIWNDTAGIAGMNYDHPPGPDWYVGVLQYFRADPADGYRPLSALVSNWSYGLFYYGPFNWFGLACIFSGIVGATGVAVQAVAARLLRSENWAHAATLLALCSPGFLTGAFVIYAGIQPIVPLLMCLGLLLYWNARDSIGARRILYLAGLAVVFVVGPWFREFLGIVPLLILAEEVLARDSLLGRIAYGTSMSAAQPRSPAAVVLAGLGFLHALFPMALPGILLFQATPVRSVFAIGNLSMMLGGSQSHDLWTMLTSNLARLENAGTVSLSFLALFPVSLVALAYVGYGMAALKEARAPRLPGHLGAFATVAMLPVILVATVPLMMSDGLAPAVAVSSAVGLAALGASVSPMLGVWLFLSFAPFFLVFTEIVHLAYAAVPASIIIAGGVQQLWQAMTRRALRHALAAALAVLLADQALNLCNTWRVMRAVNEGLVATANELRSLVPRGATIVCNTINCFDLQLFSDNWIDTRYTVEECVAAFRIVETPQKLAALLQERPDNVYFLATERPLTQNKAAYHAHRFIRDRVVDLVDLGVIHVTDATYPYLDPLGNLIPRPFVPFLGPPDEVDDYYHGPARSGTPFLREVFAASHLYKVSGGEVREHNDRETDVRAATADRDDGTPAR